MTLWTGASPSWWLARLGKAGGIGGTGLKNEELKSAGLIGTSATPKVAFLALFRPTATLSHVREYLATKVPGKLLFFDTKKETWDS